MRLIAVAVLCLLAACCATVPSEYGAARPSTLRLEWAIGKQVCSGVAIGTHTVITAAHCTTDALGEFTIDGKPGTWTVLANDGNDHVMLRVTQRLTNIARVGREPRVGQELFLWGQPDRIEHLLRVGRVAGTRLNADGEWCIGSAKTCDVMFVDMNLTYGDSGGGFFNARGELVGIESGGYSSRAGWVMPFFYPIKFTPAQLRLRRG